MAKELDTPGAMQTQLRKQQADEEREYGPVRGEVLKALSGLPEYSGMDSDAIRKDMEEVVRSGDGQVKGEFFNALKRIPEYSTMEPGAIENDLREVFKWPAPRPDVNSEFIQQNARPAAPASSGSQVPDRTVPGGSADRAGLAPSVQAPTAPTPSGVPARIPFDTSAGAKTASANPFDTATRETLKYQNPQEFTRQQEQYKILLDEHERVLSDPAFKTQTTKLAAIATDLNKDKAYQAFVEEGNALSKEFGMGAPEGEPKPRTTGEVGRTSQTITTLNPEQYKRWEAWKAKAPQFKSQIAQSEEYQRITGDKDFQAKAGYEEQIVNELQGFKAEVTSQIDNERRADMLKKFARAALPEVEKELASMEMDVSPQPFDFDVSGAPINSALKYKDPQKAAKLELAKKFLGDVVNFTIPSDDRSWLENLFRGVYSNVRWESYPWLGDLLSAAQTGLVNKLTNDMAQGKKLSPEDQQIVDAHAALQEVQALPGVQDAWFQLGNITGAMPKYMIEFGATSGVYSLANRIVRSGMFKVLGKAGYQSLLRAGAAVTTENALKQLAANAVVQAAPSVIAGATQSLTNVAGIAKNAIEYMTPAVELALSPQGQLLSRELDKEHPGDDALKAFLKGVGVQAADYVTENWGVLAEKPIELMKDYALGTWMKKTGLDVVLDRAGKSAAAQAVSRSSLGRALTMIRKAEHWNGIFGETFEEIANQPIQSYIETGKVDLMSPKDMLVTAGAMAVPMLLGVAAKATQLPKAIREQRLVENYNRLQDISKAYMRQVPDLVGAMTAEEWSAIPTVQDLKANSDEVQTLQAEGKRVPADPHAARAVAELRDAFQAAKDSGTRFNFGKRLPALQEAIGQDPEGLSAVMDLQTEIQQYNRAFETQAGPTGLQTPAAERELAERGDKQGVPPLPDQSVVPVALRGSVVYQGTQDYGKGRIIHFMKVQDPNNPADKGNFSTMIGETVEDAFKRFTMTFRMAEQAKLIELGEDPRFVRKLSDTELIKLYNQKVGSTQTAAKGATSAVAPATAPAKPVATETPAAPKTEKEGPEVLRQITRKDLREQLIGAGFGTMEHVEAALALVDAAAGAKGMNPDEFIGKHIAGAVKGQVPDDAFLQARDASGNRAFTAVAIKHDGVVHKGEPGEVHPHIWNRLGMEPDKAKGDSDGFIASDGRFLSREEAQALILQHRPQDQGPWSAESLHMRERGILSQGAKGAVSFLEDGRAVIHALESPDISTLVHELGHIFRKQLSHDELKAAEGWAGVEDGKWTKEAEEKFARAFELYLRNGEAPDSKLKEIFEKLKQWLSAIYRSVRGSAIDVKFTPEMKALFHRMLGKTGEEAETEEKGVDDEDKARSLAESRAALLKRLNGARDELPDEMKQRFSRATFDFKNKRYISSDGRLALQYQVRERPNEPISTQNPQSETGFISVVEYKATVVPEEASFEEALDRFKEGSLPRDFEFELGAPSAALKQSGVPDYPIVMGQQILHKATEKKHGIELGDLRGLPEAISDPIMVFKSLKRDDSRVILTTLVSQGRNLVVALELAQERKHLVVNDVRSVYPKDGEKIVRWMEKGLVEYADKEKSLRWLESAGLQLPGETSAVRLLEQYTARSRQNQEAASAFSLKEQKSLLIKEMEKAKSVYNAFASRTAKIEAIAREVSTKQGPARADVEARREELSKDVRSALEKAGFATDLAAIGSLDREGVRVVIEVPGDGTFRTPIEKISEAIERVRKDFPGSVPRTVSNGKPTARLTGPGPKLLGGQTANLPKLGYHVIEGVVIKRGTPAAGLRVGEEYFTQHGTTEERLSADVRKTLANKNLLPTQRLGFVEHDAHSGHHSVSVHPLVGGEAEVVFRVDDRYYRYPQSSYLRAVAGVENPAFEVGPNGNLYVKKAGSVEAVVASIPDREPGVAGKVIAASFDAKTLQEKVGDISFLERQDVEVKKREAQKELDRLDKEMKELLKGQSPQLSATLVPLDPEIAVKAAQMAIQHVKLGFYTFAEYSRAMLGKFGEVIRQYLHAAYAAARSFVGPGEKAKMDDIGLEGASPEANAEAQKKFSALDERAGEHMRTVLEAQSEVDRLESEIGQREDRLKAIEAFETDVMKQFPGGEIVNVTVKGKASADKDILTAIDAHLKTSIERAVNDLRIALAVSRTPDERRTNFETHKDVVVEPFTVGGLSVSGTVRFPQDWAARLAGDFTLSKAQAPAVQWQIATERGGEPMMRGEATTGPGFLASFKAAWKNLPEHKEAVREEIKKANGELTEQKKMAEKRFDELDELGEGRGHVEQLKGERRLKDDLDGALLSVTPLSLPTIMDKPLSSITHRMFLSMVRVIGKLPESIHKWIRAPFSSTPEIRAAYEDFRRAISEAKVDVNKLTRMILGADATEEEYIAVDRLLRGHPDDFNALPPDVQGKFNALGTNYHEIAQRLTAQMQALGLPIREEWLNGPAHWYPNLWKEHMGRMILGHLFSGGGRQTRIGAEEAGHAMGRITDRYVVFQGDGSIAADPTTKLLAVYKSQQEAEAFVARFDGFRLTYVDRATNQFVEERFDSYAEREKLVKQLYDDDSAYRPEKKKALALTIAPPMPLEEKVGHGLIEDPLINVRRGIRGATGLVAKTRFFTVLGHVAAVDEEQEGYVQLKDYKFTIPDHIIEANDDVKRLAEGWVPKTLAEELVAWYGPRGFHSQLYDVANNALKATVTVYNPFRYAKQPIENELSLLFADTGLFLNKPKQAIVFAQYWNAVVNGKPDATYDLFLKLGGDKEDFYTAEMRRYGRDLSSFRDIEGTKTPLSIMERLSREVEENKPLGWIANKADLMKAIYHHEDIIYKYYAFVGWMGQGMTPVKAMERVENSFFYGKESPRYIQTLSRHIPFMPRVTYEFSRIILSRLRDYPASTILKVGMLASLYAMMRRDWMEEMGWTDKSLARMGDAAPDVWDILLPITDKNGRNVMISIRWLLPYAELGMFNFSRQTDVAGNALQLTPFAFRGAVSTAFGKTSMGRDITQPGDPDWKMKYAKNMLLQYMPMLFGQYWVSQYKNAMEKDPRKSVPWYEKAAIAPAIGQVQHVTKTQMIARGQQPVFEALRFLEDEKRKIQSSVVGVMDIPRINEHNAKVMKLLKATTKKYNVPVSISLMNRYMILPGEALGPAVLKETERMMQPPLERTFAP